MFSVSFDTAVVSGNMERQRSSRPGSEILYALQKLKEILQQKNKQFALFELDVHSSQNNLSVVKSMKSNASSSKHKAIDELRLVEEISENFTGADAAVKKEERGMHKVINGEKLLTDSRARSSNGVSKMSLANTSRGKIYRNSHEGKQEAGLETGLSKILCQDSIACNVTREQRTNILALKKGPEETWVHAQNE
ncbi:hypothetical protein GH714_023919 [Hevea brasiliensis]|uniref:Uncharacterized protein n=1 Tax=Hevea brasiliensis TaxID=3981 RepID=A0A6A6LLU8_HEVBR|nr:hypothetical protein GH714_023919 [Hevea brasiliensis]